MRRGRRVFSAVPFEFEADSLGCVFCVQRRNRCAERFSFAPLSKIEIVDYFDQLCEKLIFCYGDPSLTATLPSVNDCSSLSLSHSPLSVPPIDLLQLSSRESLQHRFARRRFHSFSRLRSTQSASWMGRNPASLLHGAPLGTSVSTFLMGSRRANRASRKR